MTISTASRADALGARTAGREFLGTILPPVFSAVVPIPPSLNTNHVNVFGKGRVKSKKYIQWKAAAHNALNLARYRVQGFITIYYPVSVVIEIDRSCVDRDLDNCVKPILDALKGARIWTDDKLVSSVFACWAPGRGADSEARITLFRAGSAPPVSFAPSPKNVAVGHVKYRCD